MSRRVKSDKFLRLDRLVESSVTRAIEHLVGPNTAQLLTSLIKQESRRLRRYNPSPAVKREIRNAIARQNGHQPVKETMQSKAVRELIDAGYKFGFGGRRNAR